MKFGSEFELDGIDRQILVLLQENCEQPLAKIGEQVGLSAPAVVERIKKLEEHGVICAYRAIVDARLLGKDVTAFIGVSIDHPRKITAFEERMEQVEGVLECHHVTGGYTLLLKVKTDNTSTLEELISRIRYEDGVSGTETMVVLSTHTERTQIAVGQPADTVTTRRPRRNGDRQILRQLKGG
ncbi:MAG TPA: Lrp/AsnC family transcriptional regulator [Terriglobales bacterium]|nr:Lrp/AsnC family transcriptional regulator [Terriglobales bacterium]